MNVRVDGPCLDVLVVRYGVVQSPFPGFFDRAVVVGLVWWVLWASCRCVDLVHSYGNGLCTLSLLLLCCETLRWRSVECVPVSAELVVSVDSIALNKYARYW